MLWIINLAMEEADIVLIYLIFTKLFSVCAWDKFSSAHRSYSVPTAKAYQKHICEEVRLLRSTHRREPWGPSAEGFRKNRTTGFGLEFDYRKEW